MKISVIFTGGTIGSAMEGKYISLHADSFRLLQLYKERFDTSDIEFETDNPFSVLSENLSLNHALALAGLVGRQAGTGCYDAIILTHGTDSLQYTASLLEWMCGDLNIPVFLVSSSLVLDDPDSNGLVNFHGAITAAREKMPPSVYVSWQNPGEDLCIHRASMLLPHQIFSENIYSVKNKIAASVKDNRLILSDSDFRELEVLDSLRIRRTDRLPHILMLHIYPGMGEVFAQSALPDDTDAIILTAYHSGTLPTEQPSFIRFCAEANRRNIPIYVCGTYMRHGYISTGKFEELSLLPMPWISPIALYTRLVSLCAAGETPAYQTP
ncbi:MAG: asparaginase domain-containing protein [Lachnospiraceae bacterium]|nr:asparaginase domain-containing protein [Lachnospiraceae bacterium]